MARFVRDARFVRVLLVLIVALGIGGLAAWGFVAGRGEAALDSQRETPVAAPSRVSHEDGRPMVKLDATDSTASNIETTPVAAAPYRMQVTAYGTVLDLARPTDLANSYAHAHARAQLQGVEAKLAASRTAFDRARTLNQNQNASTAQMQAAQAVFLADQSAVAASAAELRTLAATIRQEWGAVLGQALVDGASVLTQLIERDDVLVQVTLPPGVSVPMPPPLAVVETADGRRAQATFLSAAARTDPRIQGMSFLYTVSAGNGVLPGMNVLAFLPSGITDGTVVPMDAIVWWNDRAWAYRRVAPGAFERVKIATELPAPGGGYIVTSLPHGTQFVTSGAQALLSEEFRAQLNAGVD